MSGLRLASGLGCRACVFGFLVYGLVWAGIVASWFAGFACFAVCCVCCGLGCFVGFVFCGVLRVGLDFWFSVLCCGAVGFGGGVGWVRVVFGCGGYWYLVCGL